MTFMPWKGREVGRHARRCEVQAKRAVHGHYGPCTCQRSRHCIQSNVVEQGALTCTTILSREAGRSPSQSSASSCAGGRRESHREVSRNRWY